MFEVCLCALIVSGHILGHAEVVERAVIFRIQFGCCIVDLHLFQIVIGQSGDIEDFLLGELLGILVEEIYKFLIALAESVDSGHHA